MWRNKLDPYLKNKLDTTKTDVFDVIVSINDDPDPVVNVVSAGFVLYYRIDDILTGIVHRNNIQKLAEVDCVCEIHLSTPLYEETLHDKYAMV